VSSASGSDFFSLHAIAAIIATNTAEVRMYDFMEM
jgi:hypothetical protein